jgi:hypothetical protein
MVLAAAIALTGCASTIGDSMPAAIGGLPDNAPQRPETPPAYPAVHDRPPPRDGVLSGREQKKLEDELAAARAKAGTGTNRNP